MTFTTEAYVSRGPLVSSSLFRLETVHLSDLAEHEILLEPVSISICHSDVKAAQGEFMLHPPLVPGHESAGFVKHVGPSVTYVKPGDAVVVSFASCMTCTTCLAGRPAYCDLIFALNFSGRRLNGSTTITDEAGEPLHGLFFGQSSMSRLILANENSAIKVEASREELKSFAPLSCGIQTGAGAILNVAKPPPNSAILVFGAGAVGLSCLLAAALFSPSYLILVDTSADKLAMPATNIATHKILSPIDNPVDIAAEVHRITNGRMAEFAIDAVGSGKVLGDGHSALAKCGMLITIGGNAVDMPQFTLGQHLQKGITYRGTHQGDAVPREFIPRLIELWRQGKFPFEQMLTFFPFEELDEALSQLKMEFPNPTIGITIGFIESVIFRKNTTQKVYHSHTFSQAGFMKLSPRLLATIATPANAGNPLSRSTAMNLLPPIPLYRRLFRAHRHKLPLEERLMGDMYIKSEFRAHRDVENPMHIIGFLTEWQLYAQQLEGDSWRGEKLDQAKVEKMSDQQIGQLYELMETIRKQKLEDEEDVLTGSGGGKSQS